MIIFISSILLVGFSYLYGSIPFGVVFARLRGIDLQKTGSGNIGATNVLISAGLLPSLACLFFDLSKGFLPILLAKSLVGNEWVIVLCGLAGVLGHNFSAYLGFKGGKGVASSIGAMLMVDPVLTIIVILFWPLIFVVWRYFIPTTIALFLAMPFVMFFLGHPIEHVALAIGLAILAVIGHRKDIMRFLSGEEKESESKLLQNFKFRL